MLLFDWRPHQSVNRESLPGEPAASTEQDTRGIDSASKELIEQIELGVDSSLSIFCLPVVGEKGRFA